MAAALIDVHMNSHSLPLNDQWSCPQCSFINPLMAYPRCEICEAIDPQSEQKFSAKNQAVLTWKCSRCTLLNLIISARCTACGKAKPPSEKTATVVANLAATLWQTYTSRPVRDRRHVHESDAETMFQHIITYCRKHKTHFVDDQFTPSHRSIGEGSFDNVSQWLRISDIAPASDDDRRLPLTIFSSPQPSDIQQGALGNCWLIAALALISERPRLLEHILLTKTVNPEGVYLVRICHNGLWKTIIVDDCFPCTKHKHLVFTQAKRRQLYVPLIEKACAKVYGSYASLKSGNMLEGLQLLTGAPCDHIDLKPTDQPLDGDIVWAKLLSACESKLLIGVSSGGSGVSREEYARVHIHGNHAFSILAAHALVSDSSRYVLVRDPHSRSQYTEESVTESVLQRLRVINAAHRSTGAFWISWNRFLRYFSSITISTYNSDHFDIREVGKFTRSSTADILAYLFHVPQTSLINISLLYHRHHRKLRSFHTQSFVLCDADELSSTGVIGRRESILICNRGRFTYWTGLLRTGSYVLVPFSTSFWRTTDKTTDYTVVIHSTVQLDLTIQDRPATFLADCLIAAVMKTWHKKQKKEEATFYITSSRLGMKLFVVENSSQREYLSVDININIAENVRHSRHGHRPFDTHDCIPPRYRQLIFITEWNDRNGQSSYLQYSYTHRHVSRISESVPAINSARYDLHSPRPF